MTLPIYVPGCSQARFVKRDWIRTTQEAMRTHQESTRNRLQPHKTQQEVSIHFSA